jgi:hypothetical protein
MATGAPEAELRPPRTDFPTPFSSNHGIDAPTQEAAPVGVPYQTPGAAFSDSMLLRFYTMVARVLASNGEVYRFWITPESQSPRFNCFCVANALNFHFTAYPDSFAVACHGSGIFSSYTADGKYS